MTNHPFDAGYELQKPVGAICSPAERRYTPTQTTRSQSEAAYGALQARERADLESIRPAERERLVALVLEDMPWLGRVARSRDPLKSRILAGPVLAYWRRGK